MTKTQHNRGMAIAMSATLLAMGSACTPLSAPPVPSGVGTESIVTTVEVLGGATEKPGEAATVIADKATLAARITPLPPITPQLAPTGIYDDAYVKAEWLKQGFSVQNAWFGIEAKNAVTIFAGSFVDDPKQGALKLVMMLGDRTLQEEYRTTEKHGSLKVAEATNNRLMLVAEDGTVFYFDVPGHRFVSSLEEKVPVATVPATYTPMATPDFGQRATPMPTGYPAAP